VNGETAASISLYNAADDGEANDILQAARVRLDVNTCRGSCDGAEAGVDERSADDPGRRAVTTERPWRRLLSQTTSMIDTSQGFEPVVLLTTVSQMMMPSPQHFEMYVPCTLNRWAPS
jgi:hypothetical protein